MIDVHSHLTFPSFRDKVDRVLTDSKKEMDAVITCGMANDAEEALALRKKDPDLVHVTLGVHPEDVNGMRDEQVERHMSFIMAHRRDIVGVGEIGLDNHWVRETGARKRCAEWLRKLLGLADEMDMPVVLHTRKAEEEVFDVVSRVGAGKVVFHHYAGNMTLAKKILDEGHYISMPTITPTSKNLLKIAERFPLESLLTETDSPFNSPFEGQDNVPANVRVTIDKIAEKKGQDPKEVDRVLTKNAEDLFGI